MSRALSTVFQPRSDVTLQCPDRQQASQPTDRTVLNYPLLSSLCERGEGRDNNNTASPGHHKPDSLGYCYQLYKEYFQALKLDSKTPSQGKNILKLKALVEESKLKQVDRRISVNAPTILIILNEILTVNTPVSTMQQSPNVYLNWLACITNISGAKQHKEVTSHSHSKPPPTLKVTKS